MRMSKAQAAAELAVRRVGTLVEALREREEAAMRAAGRVNSIRDSTEQALERRWAWTVDLDRTAKRPGRGARDGAGGSEKPLPRRSLNDIRDECNRLYEAWIPMRGRRFDDRVGCQAAGVARPGGAVRGGRRCAAQAYLSEAHLDTLGFCVWLAFAKRPSGRARRGGERNGAGAGRCVLVGRHAAYAANPGHHRGTERSISRRSSLPLTNGSGGKHSAIHHGPGGWADLIELQ